MNATIFSDTTLAEKFELQEHNKELEDRIWNLELCQKRQSYHPEQCLGLQLNRVTPDRHLRQFLKLSQDCTSSVSSGFASGSESTGEGSLHLCINTITCHFPAIQPYPNMYLGRYKELEEETERLSELIGVMEEREEQLLDQVEEVGIARTQAEEKVKEKENLLVSREQKDQLGRRVKNALLLTAAFGAVHQAIGQEMVMGCMPM